eukprot:EG_transcript_7974
MPASVWLRVVLAIACCLAPAADAASNRSWHPLAGRAADALTCGWHTEVLGACSPESDDLRRVAHTLHPVTDKVHGHVYHLMYGIFLGPFRHTVPFKFFEIGLGCDMEYGPGASARMWRQYLANADLWEADLDQACVRSHSKPLRELGITALHGNQANFDDLRRWVKQTGGRFNAVVDDGGHSNTMILKTFALLWGEVVPCGLYFLEDLTVGRARRYDDTHLQMVVSDVLQAWVEELVVGFPSCNPAARKSLDSLRQFDLWRLPRGLQWMFCQPEACALRKAPANDTHGPAGTPANPLQLDLFAALLRPLSTAAFQPRILLHGLRCSDHLLAVGQWLSAAPKASLMLLNPERDCEGNTSLSSVGATAFHEGLVNTTYVPADSMRTWVAQLSFRFDVVVDCSNGSDVHTLETFVALWPSLKGSGLYFVSHLRGRSPAHGGITVVAVIQGWIDGLLIGKQKYHPKHRPPLPSGANPWRLPAELLFVGCEGGACALGRWARHTRHSIGYKTFFGKLRPNAVGLRYDPNRRCQ